VAIDEMTISYADVAGNEFFIESETVDKKVQTMKRDIINQYISD
jgi:hypothetical protein